MFMGDRAGFSDKTGDKNNKIIKINFLKNNTITSTKQICPSFSNEMLITELNLADQRTFIGQ